MNQLVGLLTLYRQLRNLLKPTPFPIAIGWDLRPPIGCCVSFLGEVTMAPTELSREARELLTRLQVWLSQQRPTVNENGNGKYSSDELSAYVMPLLVSLKLQVGEGRLRLLQQI